MYALELEGRTVDLAEGESTIGRSRGCTVTLRDPSASRNHVLITVKPGDVRARDLQSSNGTYLNGERLTAERLLHDGDRITIGETDIVVRITAPDMEEVGATVRLESAKLQCPACGAELPVHADFCARCGHRVGSAAAAGAALAPAPPPPPASAPAVPPPLPVPPMVPPPLAPAPGAAYAEPSLSSSPAAPDSVTQSELLPPIADDVFHAAGAASAAPARSAEPRPALPPTPPPRLAGAPTVPPRVVPQASPEPAVAASPAGAYRPAGFWIRLLAQIVDVIWMTAVALIPTLLFGGPLSENGVLVLSLGLTFLDLMVPLLGWGLFGATPGKALFGLRVIGAARRRRGIGLGVAFLRICGVMVSAALLGLGFLMIAFTRDKRGLHDHLAGTAVIRR